MKVKPSNDSQEPLKSITLITSSGKAKSVAEELFKRGVLRVGLQNARGNWPGAPVGRKGFPVESEQEILTCIVEESTSDTVFSFIFEYAQVDQPGGGFIYMGDVSSGSGFAIG